MNNFHARIASRNSRTPSSSSSPLWPAHARISRKWAVPITKPGEDRRCFDENKKEFITDLIVKANQVEYLIQSMPVAEGEELQNTSLPQRGLAKRTDPGDFRLAKGHSATHKVFRSLKHTP
ncbi:hypothetical protein C8R47DRAFT_1080187 [Mycena vitilis]|nr:hypothetical protein C8R47DRAFT_1080187 [Mycena vitilis]